VTNGMGNSVEIFMITQEALGEKLQLGVKVVRLWLND
jgi:hypothetical protein